MEYDTTVGKIKNEGTWQEVLDYHKEKLKVDAAAQLRAHGLPFAHGEPYGMLPKEFVFRGIHGGRKWRFDLAWLAAKVAIEIEGGTGRRRGQPSRHLTPKGFDEDCVKYGEAAAMGWRIIRVTPRMIYDDTMVNLAKTALRE